MSNQSKPLIVSIEGNIGSGKSTLIDMMDSAWGGENSKYVFLREPVDVWENIKDKNDDENILQKFYKDSDKYAFSFQIMAYMTFYQQLINAIINNNENTIIICERSMDSSKAIFAKMLYDYGTINNVDYQVLEMFYYQMEHIHLDAIIYLDVDINTCNDRIKSRARIGEHDIQIDYLEKCAKYHKEWLETESYIYNKNFIRIDGNQDFKLILSSVRDFLKNIEKKTFEIEPFKNENVEIDLLLDENIENDNTEQKYVPNIEHYNEIFTLSCNNCKSKICKNVHYYFAHKKEQRLNFCNICFDEISKPYIDDGWNFYKFYYI